jgi:biotin operon repressor
LPPQAEQTGQDLPSWLLNPEHVGRMGGALWVFLWLWQEGRAGDSPHVRGVRSGGVVRVEEIAEALGLTRRSIQRSLATLRDEGYLTTWQEQYGFTALVNIWDAGKLENAARGDKSGAPDQAVRGDGSGAPGALLASGVTEVARLGTRDDKSGAPGHPPAPPLRVLEDSSLESSSSGAFLNVPTTAKTAHVVPIRGGRDSGPPRPAAAVAAGQSPGRLRQEQAITHMLSRIEAWERPALTRTLREALCAVPLSHLGAVFEQAWRLSRTRDKDQRNPAGWWAETLRRSAEACVRDVKGALDYG